jgi:2-C-methyl-D-erythritol 2,4-cyclodiphosphate synthase
MREKLATVLKLEKDRVSIKATRPEKLGALGRKEGLVAFATVLIVQ